MGTSACTEYKGAGPGLAISIKRSLGRTSDKRNHSVSPNIFLHKFLRALLINFFNVIKINLLQILKIAEGE